MEVPLDGAGPDAVMQYALAPTITATPKDTPYLGNLTFFVEADGETELGVGDGSTTLTLLPGVRWLLFKDFWLAFGYEFPVTGTNELENRLWFSVYRDF